MSEVKKTKKDDIEKAERHYRYPSKISLIRNMETHASITEQLINISFDFKAFNRAFHNNQNK
jgi:hypothetical protein